MILVRLPTESTLVASMSVQRYSVGGNLAFAFLAEGFGSALLLRAVAGLGMAGTYMVGLRLVTDRLSGLRKPRRLLLPGQLQLALRFQPIWLGNWLWRAGSGVPGSGA